MRPQVDYLIIALSICYKAFPVLIFYVFYVRPCPLQILFPFSRYLQIVYRDGEARLGGFFKTSPLKVVQKLYDALVPFNFVAFMYGLTEFGLGHNLIYEFYTLGQQPVKYDSADCGFNNLTVNFSLYLGVQLNLFVFVSNYRFIG